jgi:site-specific DNA-methyltransferase (adenine-specific)
MHTSKTTKENAGKRALRTDGRADLAAVEFAPIDAVRVEFAELATQLSNGWLLVFCTPEGVAPWRDAIEAAGARYKRACVWVKPDAAPQFNGQGPAMGAEMVVAAWCGKGHSKWNGGGGRGVWTHNTNQPDRHGLHPTEKPVPLMRELVRLFTNKGDTVLDPFMGTGATGVACSREGRGFLGCEVNEEFFGAAGLRLQAVSGRPVSLHPGVPGLFD